jgi:hypothetical protein
MNGRSSDLGRNEIFFDPHSIQTGSEVHFSLLSAIVSEGGKKAES